VGILGHKNPKSKVRKNTRNPRFCVCFLEKKTGPMFFFRPRAAWRLVVPPMCVNRGQPTSPCASAPPPLPAPLSIAWP
jgi:hypothetical protein